MMAAALVAPVATLAWLGLSPVGMTEESTGYRYFYSLRTLYTADERPWLPQGQVMTLVHIAIQAVLTLVGYPITELTPRMEIFAYVAAGVADVCTALAALWGLRPIRSVVGQLTVIAVVVCTIFDTSLSEGYHLVAPDYYPWIHVVTLVAIGCTLRLVTLPEPPSSHWIVGLGIFAGLAISLKVTLVIFAGPPILLALAGLRTWRAMIAAAIAIGVIAIALFLSLTWLSYGGNGPATLRYYQLLFSFAGSINESQQIPLSLWFMNRLVGESAWTMRLSAAMPLLLGLSAALLRPRLVSLVLLPSCVMSLLLLWKRDQTTTFIEVMDAALLALVVWAMCVARPAVQHIFPQRPMALSLDQRVGWVRRVLSVMVSCALVAVTGGVAGSSVRTLLPIFYETEAAQRALDQFVLDPPGPVAILTLDNAHRPLNRDGAIFKGGTRGGTNGAGSDLWGVSPFVASLVPERHYFFPAPELHTPINLAEFRYVLFVSVEPPEITKAKLAEAFGASFVGFECTLILPVPGAVQHGCRRIPEVPIGHAHDEIALRSLHLHPSSHSRGHTGFPSYWSAEHPARIDVQLKVRLLRLTDESSLGVPSTAACRACHTSRSGRRRRTIHHAADRPLERGGCPPLHQRRIVDS